MHILSELCRFGNKIAWLKNDVLANHTDESMTKWRKEEILANLYLMKINFLIIKVFVFKEISSWVMKIFH